VSITLVTAPAVEPLDVAEAKARLGWGAEVDDAAVTAWIMSQRQRIEQILGRALINQTWDYTLERFPSCCSWLSKEDRGIAIPLPRLQSVTNVKYRDGSGSVQTLDPSVYRVIPGERGRVILTSGGSWPATECAPDAVTIRFVAGYGASAAEVPEPIKQAMVQGISLNRSMSRDLLVTSEMIDGVGQTNYAAGTQAGAAVATQMEAWLAPYRVGGGIS
jgi:uncharacterized phiE125 gp8 family phage protein